MIITKEQIIELKKLRNSYGKVHKDMNTLELEIQNLMTRRAIVSEELIKLRDSEISIINKIEEDSGTKVTSDYLLEILN